MWSLSARRAWIEIKALHGLFFMRPSLSARRAWIEIVVWLDYSEKLLVALRKESVDRNLHWYISPAFSRWSLSARRAWIEI